MNLIRCTGNFTFNNLASGAVVNILHVGGGDIVLNGADATVNIEGVVSTVTNNLTGSPTVTDNSISRTNINTEADTAIETYKLDHLVAVAESDDPVDNSIIAKLAASDGDWSGYSASTDSLEATADNLSTTDGVVDNLNLGIIYGAAATGTLSTTQCTSDLTGYADDQLIGRVIIFTSGDCDGEATDITDYASTNGLLTFTALTTAPANSDTFKIV